MRQEVRSARRNFTPLVLQVLLLLIISTPVESSRRIIRQHKKANTTTNLPIIEVSSALNENSTEIISTLSLVSGQGSDLKQNNETKGKSKVRNQRMKIDTNVSESQVTTKSTGRFLPKNPKMETTQIPSDSSNTFTSIFDGWTLFPPFLSNWLDELIANQDPDDHCKKGDLSGQLAVILQMILGLVSFAVLVLKRFCEPKQERRTWLIWSLDTSKQVQSMLLMHFINIFLSETLEMTDPCTFYLTSFLLDSSIGLLIIWLGLKISENLIERYEVFGGLPFGEYNREEFLLQKKKEKKQKELEENDPENPNNQINQDTTPQTDQNSRSTDDTITHNSRSRSQSKSSRKDILVNNISSQSDGNNTNPVQKTNPTILLNGQKDFPLGSQNPSDNETDQLTNSPSEQSIRGENENESHNNPKRNAITIPKCLSARAYNAKWRKLKKDSKKISKRVYALQTLAYLLTTVIEKLFTYWILSLERLLRFYKELRALLTQLVPIKQFEIALVMFVIPFILNCVMFWVIDNILMKSVGCLSTVSMKLGQFSFWIVKKSAKGTWHGVKKIFCCCRRCMGTTSTSNQGKSTKSNQSTNL